MRNGQIIVLVSFLPHDEVSKELRYIPLEEHEYLALKLVHEDPELRFLKIGYLSTLIMRKTKFTNISLAEFRGRAPKKIIRPGKVEGHIHGLDSIETFHVQNAQPRQQKEPVLA